MNKLALLAFSVLMLGAVFFLLQPSASAFTILFACNNNGSCNPGEDYINCPQDCCSAQCTACLNPTCTETDGICHIECYVPGTQCSVFRSTCDDLNWGATICYDDDSTVQCCSAVPEDCSAGQFCTAGSCTDCSTVCDGNCQSSACYGTDPDCDSLGNATLACCGNATCDTGEDCVSCSADCPGSVVCDLNTDCDDTNSLTVDVCHNPGECDSYCTNEACTIACDANSDCDDTNSLTIDTCLNPGTCDASCSNTACSVACSLDSDCDDSNSLTVDSCVNAGTCDSYCSNSTCTIVCSSDSGCDDNDPLTTDACLNPGTCDSSCQNTACSIACNSDADCDDTNDETTDTCLNAGTCDASCSNEVVEAPCSSDADCDDGNPDTIDSCYRPGTAGAHCLHELGEAVEQPTTEGEFSVELVEVPESAERGSLVDVVVRVLDAENNPLEGATVSIADSSGDLTQLTALPDGRYSGSFAIAPDYPLGEQSFNVVVEKDATTGESPFELNINKTKISIDVLSPTIPQQAIGATVDFRIKLSYPDSTPVEDANVSAVVGEEEIIFSSEGEGIYLASYPLGEEHLGLLEFTVSATDSAGNDGTTTISLQVLTQEEYAWFIAGLLLLLLPLLIVLLLVLLFYMRFKHILKLERQRAKYQMMRKKAQVMIAASSGEKKKELMAKEAYLDKLIEKNRKSLALMRKRSWLTLGDIPMDLYFGLRALLYDIRHFPRFLRGKKKEKKNRAELQKIDAEISNTKELIKKLENDFYKQKIPPDEFKKALFEYREKIHLLGIKKKKLL